MQITFCNRWLLVLLLLASTCVFLSYGRRGSSGSRPSSSRPSYSRPAPAPAYRPPPAPAYRPPPAPAYRPPPAPAYKPPPAPRPATSRPAPAYKPSPRPAPKPSPRPQPPVTPRPPAPVVVRQPAYNPDFKQGSADKQPAYNPNYKPGTNVAAGSSPHGPPYPPPNGPNRPNQPGVQPPPYPGQPSPYPVQPGYPGGHASQPGVNPPYPVQPGYHGGYPSQPGVNRPYPVQPGYPGGHSSQPGVNRPYPVQPGYPGSSHQQPGINRPYPVQPGFNYPHHGGNKPYPQQPLGGNVWQPHYGQPAPAYMNYGGIPTGTNMHTKPHKKKGFLGSLMSVGKQKPAKLHKYHGSYPSPYSVGGLGHMDGGFLGKHGKSASMYTIFPYMAAKKAPKLKFKPNFGFMPMYIHRPHYHYYHHHHHHDFDDDYWELGTEISQYYDVYHDDYAGKCQQPLKKEHSEIKCKHTFDEIQCDARCEEGYRFPKKMEIISNKCWHVTGVWRPAKNFPACEPVCENSCMNGGTCIRPSVCKCPSEFRGSRCQFHFMNCDVQKLVKGERHIGWVCNHLKNGTTCTVRCKEPWQFESPPADEYKCSVDGLWKPDEVPRCISKEE